MSSGTAPTLRGCMLANNRTDDLPFIPLRWSDGSASTAPGVGPQLSLISGPCSTHAQHSDPRRFLFLANAARILRVGICRVRTSENLPSTRSSLAPVLWARQTRGRTTSGWYYRFLCTLGHESLVCAQEGRLAYDRGNVASRIRTSEKTASALPRCQIYERSGYRYLRSDLLTWP